MSGTLQPFPRYSQGLHGEKFNLPHFQIVCVYVNLQIKKLHLSHQRYEVLNDSNSLLLLEILISNVSG